MVRTLLGVLAGLATMVVVIMAVQFVGAQLYPPPADVDMADTAAFAAMLASLPLAALVFVVLAWALGAFAGGWVAARIATAHPRVAAVVVALAVVAGVLAMVLAFPHPMWMSALGLALPVPLALAAARLARPRATPGL